MANIEIYTSPGCGYCLHAKRLLSARGLVFSEYDVYSQPARFEEMRSRLSLQNKSSRTFPQLFIDNEAIGGFDQLLAFERSGGLEQAA